MAKAKKKLVSKKINKVTSLQFNLDQINHILVKLEGEVENLLRKVVSQGRRSQAELKKNFDILVKKAKTSPLLKGKSTDIEKEIIKFADEVLNKVKELELIPQAGSVKKIFKEVRNNVSDIVENLVASGLVVKTRQLVSETREGILLKLSIPSQRDVEKLEKKIATLERRLGSLTKKAA